MGERFFLWMLNVIVALLVLLLAGIAIWVWRMALAVNGMGMFFLESNNPALVLHSVIPLMARGATVWSRLFFEEDIELCVKIGPQPGVVCCSG